MAATRNPCREDAEIPDNHPAKRRAYSLDAHSRVRPGPNSIPDVGIRE